MGAQENKQAAEAAYRAFMGGDAAAAMENIDDSVTWTTRGDNTLTGTRTGKQEVGELWAKLAEKGFSTDPQRAALTPGRGSASRLSPEGSPPRCGGRGS